METSNLLHSQSIIKTGVSSKRAAIYIRCSSDEAKKEGYSPDTQREKTKKLIEDSNWHFEENNIYSDIGFSGSTDKRPDFQRLLAAARNKEFDVIVVYRMDRFFRNLRLLLNTVADLRDRGIEFKSVTEPFDTSTPTGRAMFANAGVFAEWMREVGLESRNEGMVKAMKEGKWLGGTPAYGYKFNRDTQKIEIEKNEVKVVKNLFKWLVKEGLSEYKIQQRINSMRIPTKFDLLGREKKTKSKYWWNRRAIGRIIRNDLYTGVIYYRKYKNPTRVRSKDNLRPVDEWIKVEDKSIRVISPSLFKKAQDQLKKNKEFSARNTKQIYLLQHKIVCGSDGYHYQSAIRRYNSKKRGPRETKYYFCTGNRSYFTPKHCPAPTISESRIAPPIWEKLKELFIDPDTVMKEIEICSKKPTHNKKKLEDIKKTLISFEAKRERYAELYSEGSIKKEFYDKKIQECERQVGDIKKEEAKITQLLISEEEKGMRVKSIESLYSQLKGTIENATYEIKRELIQNLVEKVIKTGNKLEIEFNIPIVEKPLVSPVFADCGDNRRMD